MEAYLVWEMTNFLALYFRTTATSVLNRVSRYNDEEVDDPRIPELSVFRVRGRTFGGGIARDLTDDEHVAAMLYIMLNMPEMDVYFTLVYIDEQSCSASYPFLHSFVLFISVKNIYFRRFTREEWKYHRDPTEEELETLRRDGREGGPNGRSGPNFMDWFRNLVKKCLS